MLELWKALFALGVREKAITPDTLVGCTEPEIDLIRQTIGLPLSEDYLDLMRVAGKCAGGLTAHYSWLYPKVLFQTAEMHMRLPVWFDDHSRITDRSFVFMWATDASEVSVMNVDTEYTEGVWYESGKFASDNSNAGRSSWRNAMLGFVEGRVFSYWKSQYTDPYGKLESAKRRVEKLEKLPFPPTEEDADRLG